MTTTKTRKTKRSRSQYYIDRKELFSEVVKSKQTDQMTDRLAAMLNLLTKKYAMSPQFVGYTYNDDMQGYAIMMLVKTWRSFNPEKSDNPFAFYTQCIKNSFRQYLNKEKRHRNIRDALLVNQGFSPSHTYQNEYHEKYDDKHITHDEEDHFQLIDDAKQLQSNTQYSDTDDFTS